MRPRVTPFPDTHQPEGPGTVSLPSTSPIGWALPKAQSIASLPGQVLQKVSTNLPEGESAVTWEFFPNKDSVSTSKQEPLESRHNVSLCFLF